MIKTVYLTQHKNDRGDMRTIGIHDFYEDAEAQAYDASGVIGPVLNNAKDLTKDHLIVGSKYGDHHLWVQTLETVA